jgi:hypothetical protein
MSKCMGMKMDKGFGQLILYNQVTLSRDKLKKQLTSNHLLLLIS